MGKQIAVRDEARRVVPRLVSEHGAPLALIEVRRRSFSTPFRSPGTKRRTPDACEGAHYATGVDDNQSDAGGLLPVLTAVGAAAVALYAVFGRGLGKAVSEVAPTVIESATEASSRVANEFAAYGLKYNNAAMQQSFAQAVNRHQRWTADELAVLRDTGKTALEKAFELGRTYNGVRAKAIREGFSSKAP